MLRNVPEYSQLQCRGADITENTLHEEIFVEQENADTISSSSNLFRVFGPTTTWRTAGLWRVSSRNTSSVLMSRRDDTGDLVFELDQHLVSNTQRHYCCLDALSSCVRVIPRESTPNSMDNRTIPGHAPSVSMSRACSLESLTSWSWPVPCTCLSSLLRHTQPCDVTSTYCSRLPIPVQRRSVQVVSYVTWYKHI
jgi:hypothetical protein